MMCCWVLDNETLVAVNALKDTGLLNSPLANVGPFFGSLRIFLFGVRCLPSCFPVVCELLEKWSFEA